jgi:hypothetical protein
MRQRQSSEQVSDKGRVLDLNFRGLVYHFAAPPQPPATLIPAVGVMQMNDGTVATSPDGVMFVHGVIQCGRVLIIGASLLHISHVSTLPG